MLARKVLLPTDVSPGYVNGTLALQISDHLRNRILGWNRDQHVDMIEQKMPFDHLTLLLHGGISGC